MLTRNYNLYIQEDALELLREGPPLIRALLGMVYQHNKMSSRVGSLKNTIKIYEERLSGEHKDYYTGLIKETNETLTPLVAETRKLAKEITTYCRTVDYVATLQMGNRFCEFKPRAKRTGKKIKNYRGALVSEYARSGGIVKGFNQQGLFIFDTKNCRDQAKHIIVDIIMTSGD